jgi:hypothetical protein
MDINIFQDRLVEASEKAISWAREHVFNPLPSSYLYLLYPNQSYDSNPLEGDEEIFPEESLPDRKFLGPLNVEQVVEYLWRNGKVPEWVNVTVQAYDEHYSYLELLCCGRFTTLEEMLYHKLEGYQPFHMLSPNLPPNWESVEESGKFDIYWHGRNPLTAT